MEKIINIHYAGEITLKGGNRGQFENLVLRNIRSILEGEKISKKESRIWIKLNNNSKTEKILENLEQIFGIGWFSIAYVVKPQIEKMEKTAEELISKFPRQSIKLETKRADKSFHLTSLEINKRIGKRLEDAGRHIDLKNPERKIYLEILKDAAVISTDRREGLGGLPAGSAGRVLSLFSGGIDSPVASWLMMRRGCHVDYLHVHSYPNSDMVKKSKIIRILKELKKYHPYPGTLYIVPYSEFYKKTMDLTEAKYELVLFRRFLIRLANEIANDYKGIVTGDSLGQVASQTLENLQLTNEVSQLPIYRPLIAYNKQDIVGLGQKLGTCTISTQEYKDCCSLVAVKHPAIKPKKEKIIELEEKIDIDSIIEKTKEKIEKIEV